MQLIKRTWDDLQGRRAKIHLASQGENPPRIAFIGEAGVGKTSTVDALFRTELKKANPDYDPERRIGRVLSVQKVAVDQEVETPRGLILVTDMPGLGETIETTQRYLQVYRKRLPDADVALWILEPDRRLESVQLHLKDVRSVLPAYVSQRTVYCLNKVDSIDKGEWIAETNQPDAERRAAIQQYVTWVEGELGLTTGSVIAYSAEYFYNLNGLLEAMLEAIPPTRRASLQQRADPHTPIEKMQDPAYRALGERELAEIERAAHEDKA